MLAQFRRGPWLFVVAFAALLLAFFARVLFSPERLVLSHAGTDLLYFAPNRAFGFAALKTGDLPLWNPHIFSGTPFVGSFQTAILYPVNWVHLIFPPDRALNVEVLLNLLLSATGMHLWARHHRLHAVATWLAPAVWVFGAPFFLKIYAGHLAPIGAMCWIPWILLASDLLREAQWRRGFLLAAFAVGMQILAGHPQTLYNTGLAAVVYSLLNVPTVKNARTWRVLGVLAACYVFAAALAAVQLLTGLEAAQEGSRSGGVSLQFAKMFSLPPENFLTLLAPRFFGSPESSGNLALNPYWGRSYLWEVSLFMGVGTLALVAHGAATRLRQTLGLWGTILVLLFLALGGHTPLFHWLHAYLPGFDRFRGHSKFIVPAAALLAMLAAQGLDQLLLSARRTRAIGVAMMVAALTCVLIAIYLRAGVAWWERTYTALLSTQECYALASLIQVPGFPETTRQNTFAAMLTAGATCAVLGALWLARSRTIYVAYAVALVAVLEVGVYAHQNIASFPYAKCFSPEWKNLADSGARADRVLTGNASDEAMLFGANDIWGYDPVVLKRYLEFMAATQLQSPNLTNSTDLTFQRYHPLYRMLRCRFVVSDTPSGAQTSINADALPHVLLLENYQVEQGRTAVFGALSRPNFDPARTVILEENPGFPSAPPAKIPPGEAKVVQQSPDELLIDVELKRPAILLVTDSYSRHWQAESVAGDGKVFKVLPANHVLRAVSLPAGSHHLRLRYAPPGFYNGLKISVAAWVLFFAMLLWPVFRKRPAPPEVKLNGDETPSTLNLEL